MERSQKLTYTRSSRFKWDKPIRSSFHNNCNRCNTSSNTNSSWRWQPATTRQASARRQIGVGKHLDQRATQSSRQRRKRQGQEEECLKSFGEGERRAGAHPKRRALERAHLRAVSPLARRWVVPTKSSRTFKVPHRTLTRMAAERTTTKRISNPKPLKFENLSRIESYDSTWG